MVSFLTPAPITMAQPPVLRGQVRGSQSIAVFDYRRPKVLWSTSINPFD
jgi:hypothetical protein